jgi:3-oxoacyl-[acyl-carrier protein] reductase
MADTQRFFLTGCASGIGNKLAQVLLEEGHTVYATDVNIADLETKAKEQNWPADRAYVHSLNVCDYEAWQMVFARAVETMGHVDVVMNIAGILQCSWVQETPCDDVHRMVDINVKGVMFGTQIAAAHMVERGSGHIVNIASMSGLVPVYGMAVYSASKFAVRGYSLVAAIELRRKGVYVTVVCPDAVQTPLVTSQTDRKSASMLFAQGANILTVDDIARVVVGRVLTQKPLEVAIPRARGLLSKFVNAFPATVSTFLPHYIKKGEQEVSRRREVKAEEG